MARQIVVQSDEMFEAEPRNGNKTALRAGYLHWGGLLCSQITAGEKSRQKIRFAGHFFFNGD